MRLAWMLAWAVLLVGAPLASAGAASLVLTSSEELALSGDAVAVAPAGHLHATAPRGGLVGEVRGLDGTLTLWTWTVAKATVADDAAFLRHRVDDARRQDFSLSNATLAWDAFREPGELAMAAAPGGEVRASGEVSGAGFPFWIPRPVPSEVRLAPPQRGEADNVVPAWGEGWPFVGTYQGPEPWRGFPLAARGALVAAEGPVAFAITGGTARVTDGDGRVHSFSLGAASDAEAAPGTGVERRARLVFRGAVHDAAIRMPDEWGLSAPRMHVRLEGEAQWTKATGTAATEDGLRTFEDARVEGEGVLRLRAEAAAPAEGVGAIRHEADGTWTRLRIGSAEVVEAPRPALPPGSAWAGLAILSALAAYLDAVRAALLRGVATLYMRLRPDDVLQHPTRRRIHAFALANPGVHLRRLHREVGGGWGTLNFHVRMLEQTGHLHVRRERGFTLVFASGHARAAAPVIPHPTAREIHARIPEDGTPVEVPLLRARVGISRQLLDHHLRWLSAHGLVEVTRPERGNDRNVRRRDSR